MADQVLFGLLLWEHLSGVSSHASRATGRTLDGDVYCSADSYLDLRILLAHSGGTLPQLSSRLASCIDHDPVVAARLQHDARFYLGKLFFDAVAYGPEELGFVSEVVSRAARYAPGADKTAFVAASRKAGSERMMFGTDHPFFPPLSETEMWKSVVKNLEAIDRVDGARRRKTRSEAGRLFGLA